MAPSIVASESDDFPAKLTKHVCVCTLIAAVGGLMFGYDIGISGGVTSMDDFLEKFFPAVYEKKHRAKENNYCKYDNQTLQLFTSSLYLAAIVASLMATLLCKKFGRRITIILASVFFLSGAILNTVASTLNLLIAGRICLGIGVGFANTAVPLFISEIAPAKYRGLLNITFQLLITVGILVANCLNYLFSQVHPYGWRLSLGGAAVPALILLIGSLFIVETPTSLIERGKKDQGLKVLKKIRGVENVENEFEAIVHATEQAKRFKKPVFKTLMARRNRPQLIVSVLLQICQQFTGINVIMFYAPVLFQTIGLGSNAALLSAVVTGSVNVVATLIANFFVDKLGRKTLLIEAAFQMFVAQAAVGVILTSNLGTTNTMTPYYAMITLAMICVFVSGFAWSWGPLGWLIPSEIFPMETRNVGFFCAVSTNMFFTFLIAQAFLSTLCLLRSYIFFFFALCIVGMFVFAIFFVPETKGVPIDQMTDRVWKKHWFWKQYYDEDNDEKEDKTDKKQVLANGNDHRHDDGEQAQSF